MNPNILKKYLRLSAVIGILFLLVANGFAQPIDPLSLHFKKDYQVRNFYNSSVGLSKLDFSQNVEDEVLYPKLHLTSPGCTFKQKGRTLLISNQTVSDQHSYIHWYKAEEFAKGFKEE